MTGLPGDVFELEARSLGPRGEPTLALAYARLAEEWRAGSRGREVGLHLMFLAWYLLCEPPYLTGHHEGQHHKGAAPSDSLADIFCQVHEYFLPSIESDAEMLYVVGLMAQLFPYLLGDEARFEALACKYRERYRFLAPAGIAPEQFHGRGAYGEYFAGQAAVSGGY